MANQMKLGEVSPFRKNRQTLLEYYGAASILRRATTSMWCGRSFSLSKLGYLDEEHLEIFKELLNHYMTYGENDDDFLEIGRECKEMEDRIEEQNAAAED